MKVRVAPKPRIFRTLGDPGITWLSGDAQSLSLRVQNLTAGRPAEVIGNMAGALSVTAYYAIPKALNARRAKLMHMIVWSEEAAGRPYFPLGGTFTPFWAGGGGPQHGITLSPRGSIVMPLDPNSGLRLDVPDADVGKWSKVLFQHLPDFVAVDSSDIGFVLGDESRGGDRSDYPNCASMIAIWQGKALIYAQDNRVSVSDAQRRRCGRRPSETRG